MKKEFANIRKYLNTRSEDSVLVMFQLNAVKNIYKSILKILALNIIVLYLNIA